MAKIIFALVLMLVMVQGVFAASVYLTDTPTINITESDPIYTAQNVTIARTGACAPGQFVVNITTGGVVCLTPANGTGSFVLKTGDIMSGDLNMTNNAVNDIKMLRFNKTQPSGTVEGDLYWDTADKTLALKGEDWTLQLGQEIYVVIYNDKGYTLKNGYAVTPDGSNSGFLTVAYTDSSSQATGVVLGVTIQNILPGQTGMVTILGIVHDVNTSAWTPGTTLYVKDDGSGELTDVPVVYPGYPMSVGQVVDQGDLGSMFIRPRTAEADPIWLDEKGDYYNKTEVDSITMDVLKNTSLTNGYIPYFMNGNLQNSPLFRSISGDELLAYDGDLYIDDSNGFVGVNIIGGVSQSYSQAFRVQSEVHQGIGNITIVGSDYDGYSTGVIATDVLPVSFADASTVTVGETGMAVYVFSVQNSTNFRVRGTVGPVTFTSTNWSWQQAPFIDVNGPSNTERGYSLSSNGTWQWAMYVPDDSNDTKFCIQNRNAWFGGQNNALCIDEFGTTTIYGELLASGLNIGNATLNVGGIVTSFVNATSIYLNGIDVKLYNDTLLISEVNTTANIQSLGFNTTAQLNSVFDAAGAAALRAATGTCPSGQLVQNTTTSGVQCVAAGTTYLAGTGLTLSGSTFSLNTTYTGTLYYPLSSNPAGYVNTTANIQSLGFNTTIQLYTQFLNITDQRYNDSSAISSVNATAVAKASPGNCSAGYVVQNTTTGGVQCVNVMDLVATNYYGEMYNDSASAFTMTTQDVWYNLTSWTSGELNGVTVNTTAPRMTITNAGLYRVMYSLSASVNNNDILQFRLLLNGGNMLKSNVENRFGNDQANIVSHSFLYRFAANSNITLQVLDTSRSGAQITVIAKDLMVEWVAS